MVAIARPQDVRELDSMLREVLAQRRDLLKGIVLTEPGLELVGGAEAGPWSRGGCGILAQAICEWLGPPSELVVLCDRQGPLHAAVRLEGMLLDGYGVSREERRMEEVNEYIAETGVLDEQTGEADIVSLGPWIEAEILGEGIPLDAKRSAELAASLAGIDPRGVFASLRPEPEIETQETC